jgi:hypothetical protein
MPVSQDLMQQVWCLLVLTVSALNILPKPYTVLPSHGLPPTNASIMTGIPIQPLVPTTISREHARYEYFRLYQSVF